MTSELITQRGLRTAEILETQTEALVYAYETGKTSASWNEGLQCFEINIPLTLADNSGQFLTRALGSLAGPAKDHAHMMRRLLGQP